MGLRHTSRPTVATGLWAPRSAEVRQRGLPGRRWGASTHLHQLLLRPDLNGLHLLRRLRLDPVRVEENLEAEGPGRGGLGDSREQRGTHGQRPGSGQLYWSAEQRAVCPETPGPGASQNIRWELWGRANGGGGQAQDWGIPLVCVLVFQCCTPGHTGAGHSG